ncbi:phage tail protein [uncultured Paludibaculum sp.]|uniref:phage tail protein n=1 Tax=uncultured Paludibaculum sp. TaxID=1765020 RepID=UPI002AABE27F|nr:phage tail protein [uncultured Paludibaculum sp.]
MGTIHSRKKLEVLDTPLLVFDCTLADGRVERWATHRVRVEGEEYAPRLLRHGGFDLRLAGDDAIDAGARFWLELSNVDGVVSQIDRSVGWKGARLKVRFGFFDIEAGRPVSELTGVFLGSANPVDELTETTARLSFTNRLSLQRLAVPTLRIQARCPWRFPSSEEERTEAAGGDGYSPFFHCGYSAGVEGGVGNLENGAAFPGCNRTKTDCTARGMFSKDSAGNATARFGGFAFIPPSIVVRPHGEQTKVADAVDGRARANDAVPVLYGTGWMAAPVIFSRSDGNLTHAEVLVGSGPIEGVLKVVANGVELPLGQAGQDMTGTGWYNVLSLGERNGGLNLSFTDAQGQALGDPHGGMACLEVVLPNSLLKSGALPKVDVLVNGLKLQRYDVDGAALDVVFTKSPAWVLLDLLRRSGWTESELNLKSFAATAAYCDEFVTAHTPDGVEVQVPRFETNLLLTQRRSLNDVIGGLRLASALMITVDEGGQVRVSPETTIARQQEAQSEVTNSAAPLGGGWPAYEFGDGLNGFSGIARDGQGRSTFRITRKGQSESPNRLSVEFQDEFNQYQQDSLSLVDFEDAAASGCEVAAPFGAMGLPHFDQAARVMRLQISKNIQGNHYVEFETSVQAIGLRPGDLIALSHAKEGLDRALYRVLRLTPSVNFERVRIAAQRHEDDWYALAGGDPEDAQGRGNEPHGGLGTPRPLSGTVARADGGQDFGVTESEDGVGAFVELTVKFSPPRRPVLTGLAAPVVGLAPALHAGGGTLAAGSTYYYAVSAVNDQGEESGLSFVVRATLPAGPSQYAVELQGLRCSPSSTLLRVYRGSTPGLLDLIAEQAAMSGSFVDTGLAAQAVTAPDGNYDHARFQWRFEMGPEVAATQFGSRAIGAEGLGLEENLWVGCVARITRGKGAGQERTIASNTDQVLTVTEDWVVAPDGTSFFTIVEAGWKSIGITQTDSIDFLVPNLAGQWVQVTGVAVNALGVESSLREAIVTRFEVGGAATGEDDDVAGVPAFGLSTDAQGTVEVGGIGFESLENTHSIEAGTLRIHYWDELASPSLLTIGADAQAEVTSVSFSAQLGAEVGDLLQVGNELMRVLTMAEDRLSCEVERGCYESAVGVHLAGETVYPLAKHVTVLPFPSGFFGTAIAAGYSQRLALPHARIAAAELHFTNSQGDGPAAAQSYTSLLEGGLRTMSGGQYTMQYEGVPAVMASMAPPLVVDARMAVRDVRARMSVAPLGEPVVARLLVNGTPYCELTVAAGSRSSAPVSGWGRAPLPEGAELRVDILAVGTSGGSDPGRDLTVTVRV